MSAVSYENVRNMGNSESDPYLARDHVRLVNYNSDKTNETVTWNCWPKEYQYSYNYGGRSYYGYYTGGTPWERGGILRYYDGAPWESYPGSGYYVLPTTYRNVRRNIFEGIRISEIRWKNYYTWQDGNHIGWNRRDYWSINNYDDAKISMSTSENNMVFEIEVDYELCTMGFPHRDVPFFYYSRYGSTYMCNGGYFTNTTPGKEPGRSYSKVSTAWNFVSFEWGDPRASSDANKTSVGWAYQNSQCNDNYFDSNRTAWYSSKSFEYQTKTPYLKHEGWVSEYNNSQYARKSCYWTYSRTYKDKIVSSGIYIRPTELAAPHMPSVYVIPNHCDVDRRGEQGSVQVRYSHPNGNGGFLSVYCVQQDFVSGKESNYGLIIKAVCSGVGVSNGQTLDVHVDFNGLQLRRGQEVKYYVKASVDDPNYTGASVSTVTNLSGGPGSWEVINAWNSCAGGHYYNEEPAAPFIWLEDALNTGYRARIRWNHVNDPDGDGKKYEIYVQRQNLSNNPHGEVFYGNVYGFVPYCHSAGEIYNDYFDIDMTPYDYHEIITVWVRVKDNYVNDVYYSSNPITVKKISTPSVNISTSRIESDQLSPLNRSRMIDGTRGRVDVKYTHEISTPGTVRIDAYMANVNDTTGHFFQTVANLNFDSSMIHPGKTEHTLSFDINFVDWNFNRSKDIRYFAHAVDANGNKSYAKDVIDWNDCTYGHHFNDEPEPCNPWIENLSTISQDEIAKIRWNVPKDTDGDTGLFYMVYLKCEDDSKNIYSKDFHGPYINGTQKYCREYITSNNHADINIAEYNDDQLFVWIESHDHYYNNYYYAGTVLPFENTGLAPNIPQIITYQAHGERGDLSIQYSHNTGRSGYIGLYAICKYKDNSKRVFTIFKDKSINNGNTLEYTSYFSNLFGNNPSDRSCEIRYFATARTQGFSSDKVSTVPTNWTPNMDMYEDWIGGHYYNEEPPAPTLSLDDPGSNLFKNALLTWNNVSDPDNDIVKYQVYLRAKGAVYSYSKQYTYFYGANRKEDLMMYCDLISETTNNYLNIDLTHYENYAEEFDVWVRAWDTYENSYYYNSNLINFTKLEYSKPEIYLTVEEAHGESGILTVRYHHPDALLSGEALVDRGTTDGKIWLYAYVEGKDVTPVNITNLLSGSDTKDPAVFVHDQSKTIEVNFKNDINSPRSRKISYFAIARDINDDPGLYSTIYDYYNVPENERTEGHYYNGMPDAPYSYVGPRDANLDRRVYNFTYTNIQWNPVIDPDQDIVDYFLYIKTPLGLNEPLVTETFYFNDKFEERSYSRKYKIEPVYNEYSGTLEAYQTFIFNGKDYENVCTKDTTIFRLSYTDEKVQWPESSEDDEVGVYSYWMESRDRYNNSCYNSSEIIPKNRKKHKKPNEVEITCTPAHGENGDITIKYTHPENLDAKVYLYAFMNEDTTPIYIDSFDMNFTEDQLDVYEMTLVPLSLEVKYNVDFTKYSQFNRSNNICYYAVAIDTFVEYKSNDTPLEEIPYSKKAIGHYYNEEPPCTTPYLLRDIADNFDLGEVTYEETPYNTITLAWKKVIDPDKDKVNYNFYMNGPSQKNESQSKKFFGDYDVNLNKGEFNYSLEYAENSRDYLSDEAMDLSDIKSLSLKQYAEGDLTYNHYKQITPNTINDSNIIIDKNTGEEYIYYTFDISFFEEDGYISIWIETDDSYENSYYRSGKILIEKKGHKARAINAAWPRNYSTIYAKTPRIVIKLAEDDLRQETIVYWKDTIYSSRNPEHLQYFSCATKVTKDEEGNLDQFIVFRPPTSQTSIHSSKITYSVKVNNTCTDSEERWTEYTYNVFGYSLSDQKFVPIKYTHMNEIRPCVQNLLDSYGKDFIEEEDFAIKDRVVLKDSIVDNNDYNEIANPLRSLNEWINKVDNLLNMDDNSNVVIKEDFDLIEFEEQADSDYMTSDFKEWKILLYLLQNM